MPGPTPNERLRALGRRVQAFVLGAGLAVLYLVGFGLTHAWLRLVRPALLRPRPRRTDSYWLEVGAPAVDVADLPSQS